MDLSSLSLRQMRSMRFGFFPAYGRNLKYEKGIWWMPWHREAMKDVALCDKPRGAGSKL